MKSRKINKIRMRETLVSYAFLLPAMLFFIIFVLVPMGMGVVTSFFRYNMKGMTFTGLSNYTTMFADPVWQKSLVNTLLLVVGSVPITVLFALFVAAMTYEKNPVTRSFFRCVFFLPVVTGTVAVTVVWKWIYDPLNGILNWLLKSMDVIDKNIMWTGDKKFALWAILIILYIASLGNVPKDYVEAAQVDGANDFQVFWKIKWPSLLPTTLYIVVITTINSFQCFSLIQLLTSGGPNYRTTTIMYYLYETAFKKFEYGYANAMGVILALIIGFISFVQFKALGSDVEY